MHPAFDVGTGFPTGFRNGFSGGKGFFFKAFALALQLLHTFVAAVEQGESRCEVVAQPDELTDGFDVVFLFEGVLVLGQQIANSAVAGGGLSEVMRIMISNGIILYALTQTGGASRD